MSTISTALTVAWLDAFRRLARPETALDAAKLPDGPSRTLTDAIEGALRGAAPVPAAAGDEPGARALDITV